MKSVLIADDDRILRKMLSVALESASDALQVFEAEDGQVAIDVLEAEKIDLVITDINMPRLNGLMVIAYLNIFFSEILPQAADRARTGGRRDGGSGKCTDWRRTTDGFPGQFSGIGDIGRANLYSYS